jgi:hypothetical protein
LGVWVLLFCAVGVGFVLFWFAVILEFVLLWNVALHLKFYLIVIRAHLGYIVFMVGEGAAIFMLFFMAFVGDANSF